MARKHSKPINDRCMAIAQRLHFGAHQLNAGFISIFDVVVMTRLAVGSDHLTIFACRFATTRFLGNSYSFSMTGFSNGPLYRPCQKYALFQGAWMRAFRMLLYLLHVVQWILSLSIY